MISPRYVVPGHWAIQTVTSIVIDAAEMNNGNSPPVPYV